MVVTTAFSPTGMTETLMTGTGAHHVAMTMDHDTIGTKSMGVAVTVATMMPLGVTADLVVAMTMAPGGEMTMVEEGHHLSGHASNSSRAAGLVRRGARAAVRSLVVPNRWTRQRERRRLKRDWQRRRKRRKKRESRERCAFICLCLCLLSAS